MILQSVDDATRREFSESLQEHLGWPRPGQDPEKEDLLHEIFATVSGERFPGAVVPVLASSRMVFYALADDGRQWRSLKPLIEAAVGMTLTSFDGRTLNEVSQDGPEGLFRARGLTVARFATRALDGSVDRERARELNNEAVRALVGLVRQLGKVPEASPWRHRGTAELLHEFDLAIQAGEEKGAQEALAEIERQRGVDSLNLRFLQIQIDAAFGHWRRLRTWSWFGSVSRTRRPPAVTAALIEALYWTELAGTLDEAPQILVEVYGTNVAPQAGGLFDVMLHTSSSAVVTTSFLLHALASQDVERLALLREMPAQDWSKEQQRRFDNLIQLAPATLAPTRSLDNLAEAGAALEAEALDAETALAALILHIESGTLGGQRAAQILRDRLPLTELPKGRVDQAGIELPEHRVPTTWIEWFEFLPDMDYETARDIAFAAAHEWSVHTQLASPTDVRALVDALGRALSGPGNLQSRSLAAVPHLVEWLQSDPAWPNPDLKSLYAEVHTGLLIAEAKTPAALRAGFELVDGLLAVGLGSEEYGRELDDLRGSLRSVVSVETLDLLLDMAELLTVHPCPEESARLALWAEILNLMAPYSSRLEVRHHQLLEQLGAILGMPPSFEVAVGDEGPRDEGHERWVGRIGVYTLREEVGHRASDILKRLYPAARIELRSDHVASAQLRRLASDSDFMVVAWSAAKHAATDAIREARADRPILWVSGGTASIIAAIQSAMLH